MSPDAVLESFLAIRALPLDAQGPALAALDDDALRAEVADLLRFDHDAPFMGEPEPISIDPDSAAPPALIGEVLGTRYEVQSMVAEGGFGWVFRGHDLARPDDGAVAIKLFKPRGADAAAVHDAIRREQQVLSTLAVGIEHVVPARGVGRWRGPDGEAHAYLAMQWLDGPTLDAHARTLAPDGMSLSDALALLAPIARALGEAHRRGVAHRDIKPANIICTGAERRPILVDFGAAKVAAERAGGFDSTGGAPGMVTYRYSAPEQLDRALGATGPWSDVHGLALMLVELMAGRHPWAELDLIETMAAVTDARRPTPRSVGLTVSDAIEDAFAAALAVPIGDRPADADALWARLDAARNAPARPARRRWPFGRR